MQFSAQTLGPISDAYDDDRDAWIAERAREYRAAGVDDAAEDMAVDAWYEEHYAD